jgi:UDP-N-acetylmuramoylalanine--D-glutamate ligase
VLSDLRSIDDLDISSLSKEVELVTGHNDLADAELVVASPGVPPTARPLIEAARGGLPIWSEPELAYRLMPDHVRLLAITGTDGKSTVTTMLGHIERMAGRTRAGRRPVWEGGNLGVPFCQGVLDGLLDRPEARAVVEVSCFQLLHIAEFRPHVAALLNVAEDHLDVHGDIESYAQAKARIFENMRAPDDIAVYRVDDARCAAAVDASAAKQVPFALTPQVLAFWAARPDPLPALGTHNILNAEAAVLMAEADGIDREDAADALATYRPLPHRLELIVDDPDTGIRWINDSKATNAHAAAAGLRSLAADAASRGGGLILLAGGVDKGLSLAPLVAAAREAGVRHAVAYGAIRERLAITLNGPLSSVREVETLEDAVDIARQVALRGDTVVLAPACSSFDQFKGYGERGETFRNLVTS